MISADISCYDMVTSGMVVLVNIVYYFVEKVTFSKVDAAKRRKNYTISEKVRCEEKIY